MNDELLKAKIHELGCAAHEYEDRQLQFDLENRELVAKIADLKDEIKAEILERKESVEADVMKVQYRKGAVKWDTKWLEGYSIDHPEILKYKTAQKPTVAFVLKDDVWDNN